jgi:hypothetical protein
MNRTIDNRVLVPVVVILALVAIWFTGAFDEPLSSVGLQRHTCAENLFGKKMCGDELEQFCQKFYAKSINGAVCDDVLANAGVDPASAGSALDYGSTP